MPRKELLVKDVLGSGCNVVSFMELTEMSRITLQLSDVRPYDESNATQVSLPDKRVFTNRLKSQLKSL